MLGFIFGKSPSKPHAAAAATASQQTKPAPSDVATGSRAKSSSCDHKVEYFMDRARVRKPLDFGVFAALDPVASLLPHWDAPSIVVLGNESAGKSTLLSRLSLIPTFPASMQRCTRCPIILSLRRGKVTPLSVGIRNLATGEEVQRFNCEDDNGMDGVRDLMTEIVETESRESGRQIAVARSRAIVIYKQDESCPNLNLVDLPGLVTAGKIGEESLHDETMQLAREFVSKRRASSLFLIIVSAKHNVNESLAMRLVQTEKLQDRCIGVVTNCDKIDSDFEPYYGDNLAALSARMNQDATHYRLSGGWLATMSRETRPFTAQTTGSLSQCFQYQDDNEAAWFADASGFDYGINTLRRRLELFYHNFLATSWAPNTITTLCSTRDMLSQTIRDMGTPIITETLDENVREYAISNFVVTSASYLSTLVPTRFASAVTKINWAPVVDTLLSEALTSWQQLASRVCSTSSVNHFLPKTLLDVVGECSTQQARVVQSLDDFCHELIPKTVAQFSKSITESVKNTDTLMALQRFPRVMMKIAQFVQAIGLRFSSSTKDRIQCLLLEVKHKDLVAVKFALPSKAYDIDDSLLKEVTNKALNLWLQGMVYPMCTHLCESSHLDLRLEAIDFEVDTLTVERTKDLGMHMKTQAAIEKLQSLAAVGTELFSEETRSLFDSADTERAAGRGPKRVRPFVHASDSSSDSNRELLLISLVGVEDEQSQKRPRKVGQLPA